MRSRPRVADGRPVLPETVAGFRHLDDRAVADEIAECGIRLACLEAEAGEDEPHVLLRVVDVGYDLHGRDTVITPVFQSASTCPPE